MKLSAIALTAVLGSASAFSPQIRLTTRSSTVALNGYLDNLAPDVIPPEEEEEEDDSREATKLDSSKVANAGVADWSSFVDFNEFDGGDGQMGVAGDGSGNKLEKFDMSQMAKSKQMSAKNAWGSNSGYAEELREKGVETSRAQQLENWHNQNEINSQRKQQQYMAEQYDSVQEAADEDWRTLAKFGVERNQDFDMDEALGAVTAGDVDDTFELQARMNGPPAAHEFGMRVSISFVVVVALCWTVHTTW